MMDKKTSEFLRKLGREAEGRFYRTEGPEKTAVTEGAKKQMDRFYEAKIKGAIKQGTISPAKRDSFQKRIEEQTK